MNAIIEKLNLLAEFQADRDQLEAARKELAAAAIPPEVTARLAEIDAEFTVTAEFVSANIAALEAEIKKDVVKFGETVKGARFQTVYSKGRVSWDSKKLDGMMALIPQLATARSVGEPTVAIRRIGGAA